jgi:ADP-ribosylglycohydrolase
MFSGVLECLNPEQLRNKRPAGSKLVKKKRQIKEVTMKDKIYRHKVMGCWLGKAVGGTLGQPYEGCDGPLGLSYYEPVPTDMIPNDDLDLQVLWAYVLDQMPSPTVDRDALGQAWLKHVAFPWDEYGIATRNLRAGIRPPFSGAYDNWFTDGLGAAIRSEIWACLAPENPHLAAAYAYEDACIDHAGDGIYAEQFLAALESAAFGESDLDRLLDIALEVIPADCRLALAIRDTRAWCAESADIVQIRQRILERWGSENFTDCVMNLPFAVAALLLGDGDFGRTICLAVNCGRDADCTTATVGAILGILNPDGIQQKWLKPIGRKLVINQGITGITHPSTLDGFTDLILSLRERVQLRSAQDCPEPDLTRHTLQAQAGQFHPWFAQDDGKLNPALPESTQTMELPGHWGSISAECIPSDTLHMMRFHFQLDAPCRVRIMFNTAANSRVWLDGNYAFGREGGRMAPSFHRAPPNQFTDIGLSAGQHELVAGVAPLEGQSQIDWVVGIADASTMLWLPEIC